jgi:SAM-dependent methyltransferase
MYLCHLGKNILAPIVKNPTLIIDLGTGSGRWPIEVAAAFDDKTRVIGIDLSPVSPSYEIPENCEFQVSDFNDGLEFDTGSVDLVHSRLPHIV